MCYYCLDILSKYILQYNSMCPRSSDPLYSNLLCKWVTTTHSMMPFKAIEIFFKTQLFSPEQECRKKVSATRKQ